MNPNWKINTPEKLEEFLSVCQDKDINSRFTAKCIFADMTGESCVIPSKLLRIYIDLTFSWASMEQEHANQEMILFDPTQPVMIPRV